MVCLSGGLDFYLARKVNAEGELIMKDTQANSNLTSGLTVDGSSSGFTNLTGVEAQQVNEFQYISSIVYRELDTRPVTEQEVIEQLHANLNHLEDLRSRLQFMMREVRYLIKA